MQDRIIVIDSDSAQLKPVRDEIDQFLRAEGFSDKVREDILVAIGEATANSIRHAYENQKGKEVRIHIENYPDRVVFRVRDFGKKIDLAKAEKPPELPPTKPHGLGVYFMKTIMDDLQYNTSHKEGNELILMKYKEKKQEPRS